MNNKESVVKRCVVTDLEVFKEDLIRCLIKGEISYVQIENEFHFLDKIYRFYDVKKLREMDLCSSFDANGIIRIISPFDILCTEDVLFADKKSTDFKPVIEDVSDSFSPKVRRKSIAPSCNRSMIRQQNRMVNQRMRNVK